MPFICVHDASHRIDRATREPENHSISLDVALATDTLRGEIRKRGRILRFVFLFSASR